MAPAKTRQPIETPEQALAHPYPTSPAVGTLKFTATSGAGEARVMSIEAPIRSGHGKRLRLHLTSVLKRGERLRDLQLEELSDLQVVRVVQCHDPTITSVRRTRSFQREAIGEKPAQRSERCDSGAAHDASPPRRERS